MEKKKILVVDDNPEMIKVIIKILELNNEFLIYHALSVDYALSIALKKIPDLVISDWEMPHKDGMALINEFGEHALLAEIPIIIVTGVLTKVEHLDLALNTGAIDFLRKPIESLELVARIRSIFKIQDYQRQLLAQKNKELALHAMYLLESKEKQINFFKHLQTVIKKIDQGKKHVLDFIENIAIEIKGDLKRDTWNDFELYFNQTHPNFTKRLAERFPEISPSEIRLCIFLRMNMSSQSIADTLHISSNSVKTARARLRTKLRIDRKINLVTFISSI